MISANYFDGISARQHAVQLTFGDGSLCVSNAELQKGYAFADAAVAEPFNKAPLLLNFADGSHCEVADPQAKQAICEKLGFRKSRVMQLQEMWLGAVVAVAVLCAILLATIEWGIPLAAEKIVSLAPESVDAKLGTQAVFMLDKDLMQPSRLSDQRIDEVRAIFDDIKPDTTRQPLRLLVRNVPLAGPNAFALPDGTIVMTDAMVLKVLGNKEVFDDFGRHQLAGVFAHEIGHVQGRHSMRVMARSSLTVALSASLFGDFSAVAAGLPTLMLKMQHSRAMETDADRYAMVLLAQHRIPTAPLAALFEVFAKERTKALDKLPRWLRISLDYGSSHPVPEDRVELLKNRQ